VLARINQHKVKLLKKSKAYKEGQLHKWWGPSKRSFSNPAPEEWHKLRRAEKITNPIHMSLRHENFSAESLVA